MLPEQGDAAYLWNMLDAARAVKEFVAGKTLHDYQKNRMLRGAVERRVASERIPELILALEVLLPAVPGDGGT